LQSHNIQNSKQSQNIQLNPIVNLTKVSMATKASEPISMFKSSPNFNKPTKLNASNDQLAYKIQNIYLSIILIYITVRIKIKICNH
jgi:hypothetical protein